MPSRNRAHVGFTLVELLVVIAIIGVLVALLLPAVQAAREAARRIQCTNQLRQIALASLTHENSHRYLPSGGWSKEWTADPNRGIGKRQPGGWPYSVLRFLEESPMRDLATGETVNSPTHRALMAQLHQTPIGLFYCPTRRSPGLYPTSWIVCYNAAGVPNLIHLAKCDYAANGGDGRISSGDPISGQPHLYVPRTYAQADAPNAPWSNLRDQRNLPYLYTTGVIYQRSQVRLSQIKDGTASTYLIGEKHVEPAIYSGATSFAAFPDLGENQSPYTGFEWDTIRLTSLILDTRPRRDTPGGDFNRAFGSAHPATFNISLCDGSVMSVSYDIDREIHRRLGNREDGLPVDSSSL